MIYPNVRLVNQISDPAHKVLLLVGSKEQGALIKILIDKKCEIWVTEDKIETLEGYDLVISFGYRHILGPEILRSGQAPIINLHISLLPWNRGAHPNFWAFYDDTPHGVTIHEVDIGIDTGPIVFQKEVFFLNDEVTFERTYHRLMMEMVSLFEENAQPILSRGYSARPQPQGGTFHLSTDLPKEFNGWTSNIEVEIKRLKCLNN